MNSYSSLIWICAVFIDFTGFIWLSFLLYPARDIKIFLGKSAENITKSSKKIITTMGEWELLDITSHQFTEVSDEKIDELTFYVSRLSCL